MFKQRWVDPLLLWLNLFVSESANVRFISVMILRALGRKQLLSSHPLLYYIWLEDRVSYAPFLYPFPPCWYFGNETQSSRGSGWLKWASAFANKPMQQGKEASKKNKNPHNVFYYFTGF